MGKLRFENKKVLVLGGTSGIGAATALALHNEAAKVVVVGTSKASVHTFLNHHKNKDMIAIIGSIGSRENSYSIVHQAIEKLGGLDILVNSAGVFEECRFEEIGQNHWDRMLSVNLEGAAFACQAALPALIASGGNIVTLASDAGLVAYPSSVAYCVAKSGVVALTKCLALEYAGQVRINCVCPSNVDTPMIQSEARNSDDPEAYLSTAHSYSPTGRMAYPSEVANAILYLASDHAEFVTGVSLPVDGGRCCK